MEQLDENVKDCIPKGGTLFTSGFCRHFCRTLAFLRPDLVGMTFAFGTAMETRQLRRSAIHRPPPALDPQDLVFQSHLIVDVRSEAAYLKSHIQGAIHIPDANTAKLLEAVCIQGDAVLVCDDGRVSANIVRMMGVCGYSDVSHLRGGLEAWTAARLPLMETTLHGERPVVPSHGRETQGVVSRVLGMLTPQVFYAGLAGAAAVLAGFALAILR